jgi:hypothetical protein
MNRIWAKLGDLPPFLISNVRMNISGNDHTGRPITLSIPVNRNPRGILVPGLSDQQIEGLWIIAESHIIEKDGMPGWKLAEIMDIPLSNTSARILAKLKKMDLIISEMRNTTNSKSSHTKTKEKAWFLKRSSAGSVFEVLLPTFIDNNFPNLYLKWPYNAPDEEKDKIRMHMRTAFKNEDEVLKKNYVACKHFYVLACLQNLIDDYENSTDWFTDKGKLPLE